MVKTTNGNEHLSTFISTRLSSRAKNKILIFNQFIVYETRLNSRFNIFISSFNFNTIHLYIRQSLTNTQKKSRDRRKRKNSQSLDDQVYLGTLNALMAF